MARQRSFGVIIEDTQCQPRSTSIFEADKSSRGWLIVFQTFIPGIIEQHCEVDQLGGEVVDERSVLLSPD